MKIDVYTDSSAITGKQTEISFDGHMLDGVVSFDIRWDMSKRAMITLEIFADDLTMHDSAILSKGFKNVYITKS